MATEEMASVAEEPRGRSISPAVQRGDQRVGHARRILVVAAVARALSAHGAPAFPAGEPGAAAGVQVPAAYGQLPVAFEANRGQTDPAVRFLARGRGQTLFLTPTEAVLVLATPARGRGDTAPPAPARGAVVRMAAVGASPALTVVGEEALPGTEEVGFAVAAYDHARPLIIDPTLSYSTYLGGSGQIPNNFEESARGIAVDAGGNAYVVGMTSSSDFPTTAGAFDPTQPPGANPGFTEDAFVTKLNPTGTALVYSTYLGGALGTSANSVAVDALGNAYVTGSTRADDFPTTPLAVQPNIGGDADAFVTKLDPTGSVLVYS